jgi:hypothetical protein
LGQKVGQNKEVQKCPTFEPSELCQNFILQSKKYLLKNGAKVGQEDDIWLTLK